MSSLFKVKQTNSGHLFIPLNLGRQLFKIFLLYFSCWNHHRVHCIRINEKVGKPELGSSDILDESVMAGYPTVFSSPPAPLQDRRLA